MDTRIRFATSVDLPRLFEISVAAHRANYDGFIPADRRESFNRRYTVNDINKTKFITTFSQYIKDPAWVLWVAVKGEEIAGYTLANVESPTIVHKKGLFVDPQQQGGGIGSTLFKTSIEAFPDADIDLIVIKDNERARHIYEKNGFVVSGEARSFYGAAQVTMTLYRH